MKKYLSNISILLLFLLSSHPMVLAQTANVFFSFPEEEEINRPAFEVRINDVLQRAKNAKVVIITDIPCPVSRIQLILSDGGRTENILQNVYLQANTIYTYHIAKDKMGNYGLFYDKESPVTTTPNGVEVMAYKNKDANVVSNVPAAPPSGQLSFFAVPDLSPTPLCTTPLKATEITSLKSSLEKEEFENRKLQAAKKLISGKCLNFNQLKEVMSLFEFEKSKLDLAKFGYHYIQDVDNYTVVQETFEFGESNSDWKQYVDFLKEYR
ncbi:MAG: DUF4476 domain-containing protein [Chitinophagales bacterium]